MSHTNVEDKQTDLSAQEGIDKLKQLVDEINTCLFCTNLRTDDGSTCRPMATQQVDEEGNLWFFSDVNSDKNEEIIENNHVQLFYSQPTKNSYMVVNGEASIIIDQQKTDELWNPLVKTWFKEGKDDPNISLIKVQVQSAYYWDVAGSKMINFVKMIASVATGTNLVNGREGTINV